MTIEPGRSGELRFSRRAFCWIAAAGAAGAAEPDRTGVALQLFSVRQQCERDLRATLARVKQIGFDAVEFAGYYNHGAPELKTMLQENGLKVCGAHVPLPLLLEHFDETVTFHRTLGNDTLVVPGLPERFTHSLDGWREAGRVFDTLATKLASAGMKLGYHNHAIEFHAVAGVMPYDAFFQSTSQAVFSELDLGGAGYGGANPIALLRSHPGRVRMIHAKDYTATKPDVMIGDGEMDWSRLFQLAGPGSRVRWFVIEHDSNGSPDLADIEESLRRFQRLRRKSG